jgi:hypothetical protein
MKRRSKNVVAFVLAATFAFGILCATLEAPGQALASVSDCSQMPGGMAMAGCDHPNYLCRFNSSSSLLSQGGLSSARYNDLSKSVHDLSIGEVPADASKEAALIGKNSEDAFLVHGLHKVSTRLLHSILNL